MDFVPLKCGDNARIGSEVPVQGKMVHGSTDVTLVGELIVLYIFKFDMK